jgi:hypothetical protein
MQDAPRNHAGLRNCEQGRGGDRYIQKLTALGSTDLTHCFRRTFHIDITALIPKLAYNNAGSPQLGYKLERLENSKLKRVLTAQLA